MRQVVAFHLTTMGDKRITSYKDFFAIDMKSNRTNISFISALLVFASLSACGGGGGSSDSGMLIEGTLTEAGGAGHDRKLIYAHTSGQRIENVEVCALGKCSTSDAQGQWGFVAPDSFNGGDVEFSIDGHGITTTSVVNIPAGASDVFIDFQHVEGGAVEAHHITVDGETSHQEDEEHAHE